MILVRYILREHLAPFLAALSVITFLFVIDFLVTLLDSVMNKGLPIGIVLEIFALNLAWMLALAVPIAWTMIEMMLLAQVSSLGQLGLSVCLMLIFYSFGENLEILAYLAWPALVLLGCAFAEARSGSIGKRI